MDDIVWDPLSDSPTDHKPTHSHTRGKYSKSLPSLFPRATAKVHPLSLHLIYVINISSNCSLCGHYQSLSLLLFPPRPPLRKLPTHGYKCLCTPPHTYPRPTHQQTILCQSNAFTMFLILHLSSHCLSQMTRLVLPRMVERWDVWFQQ